MNFDEIRNSIKEILVLTEGKEILKEGARNFRYIDGPTLDFLPEYDEENEEYYDEDYYPQFSRNNVPDYVYDGDGFFSSSLYTPYACIAVNVGYYDGIRFYISKLTDIEEFIENNADKYYDDDSESYYYSYDGMDDLTLSDLYDYISKEVEKEYNSGYEELIKIHRQFGGKMNNFPQEMVSEPETSGEEFDECALNEELKHILSISKL